MTDTPAERGDISIWARLRRRRVVQWGLAYAAGAWVLLRTGWSRRTGAEFINVSEDGPHSPGFDAKASRMLATERDVLGVGVETIGTDAGQAHSLMHKANRYGLASLCNLDQLPATGAVVIAAPLKIVHGSGSPLRVLALVPA